MLSNENGITPESHCLTLKNKFFTKEMRAVHETNSKSFRKQVG